MMIELSILKLFLNKHNFESYKGLLNPKTLSKQSLFIIKDIEVYFSTNTETEVDLNQFKKNNYKNIFIQGSLDRFVVLKQFKMTEKLPMNDNIYVFAR